jgi:hypothetical protein
MGVDTDMLMVALVALGGLCVLLALLLCRRDRELREVRELGERVAALNGTDEPAAASASSRHSSTSC